MYAKRYSFHYSSEINQSASGAEQATMKPGMIGFAAQMRTRLAGSPGLDGTSLRDPAGIDIEGILKDVEEVEKLWEMVEAVLADAEEREIREQSVRVWLHQLRDLCYDMEDVPDLFEYQLTASEVETAGTSNQVPPLENPSFWNDIHDRVSKIKQRFKNIVENKDGLQLKEAVVVGTRSDKASGSITGSYPVGKLRGRNGEFADLSRLLLKDEGVDNSNNVEVIAIVGTGGVGKTFLAQHIFQHLDDPAHFDPTGWVSVRQDFDLVGITKDVLEAFTDEDSGNCRQLHILQKRVGKLIKGKKFFLVMDDVPNLQVDQWESFFSVFVYKSSARKGSKVVITSREDGVSVTVGASHRIDLGCLTEEDGWSLLQEHAFANPEAEHPGELDAIGREIVRKCKCLPSAIKKHGQILRRNGDDDEDAWRRILEADDVGESDQENAGNMRADGASGSAIITSSRTPTGSFPSEKTLVGRDDEIDILVNLIKEEEGGSSNVQTIAIVGMGGSGKTSLAQHIFQKLKEDKHFDVTGWVFVSEVFDLVGLTRDALNAVTKQNHENNGLSWLQDKLCISVKEKKFFLVMDDMWNKDVEIWSRFVSPFILGKVKKGSKILITTREARVAQTAEAVNANCIKLKCLCKEDAWSLFQQHAFAKPIDEAQHHLIGIGKDIARKCGGLPLAIKVLGGSLRNETNVMHWNNVLKSNLSDSIQVEGASGKQILGPLYLSYLRLPPDLKTCFRYCSIFTRGEMIIREELIKFWVAHNLIKDYNPSRIYEKANGHVDELLSRSFFEYDVIDVTFCIDGDYMKMHDLLFDMLQHISGHEFNVIHEKWELLPHARHFKILDDVSVPADEIAASKKHTFWRYPSWRYQMHEDTSETLEVCEVNSLRFLSLERNFVRNLDGCLAESKLLRLLALHSRKITQVPDALFKLYNLRELDLSSTSIQVIPNIVSNLKKLIYLDVSFTGVKEIPEAICALHKLTFLNLSCTKIIEIPEATCTALQELTYLDISSTEVKEIPEAIYALQNLHVLKLGRTKITKLPESLHGLTNLEVLNLSHCKSLERLPKGITRLTRLGSLDISMSGISCMPRGISSLTGLQYISGFYVGKVEDGYAGIGELEIILSKAHLENVGLTVYGLENVTREEAKVYSGSIFSHNKHLQNLYLCWHWNMFEPRSRISGAADIDDQLFVLEALRPPMNITSLHINNYNGSRLPTWMGDVSVVNIVRLELKYCRSCTSVSSLMWLPSLEILYLSDMASLTELVSPLVHGSTCGISSSISFPKLQWLNIDSCDSITFVPLYRFPSLYDFTIDGCGHLEKIEFNDLKMISFEDDVNKSPLYMNDMNTSVRRISMKECPRLIFPEQLYRLSSLERLELEGFPQITSELLFDSNSRCSSNGDTNNVSFFPKLRELYIVSCKSITCVPLYRFPSLVKFWIRNCFGLVKIEFMCPSRSPSDVATSFLESLSIIACPQLQFSGDTLDLPKLNRLKVEGCESLQNWVTSNRYSKLAHIPTVEVDGHFIRSEDEETE